MGYISDRTKQNFKAEEMTPENIANTLNSIDHEITQIKKDIDGLPDKIMDKMKIWILGGILSALVGGGILTYIGNALFSQYHQVEQTKSTK